MKTDNLTDRLGIVASTICLVHCMLTPVILSIAAVWAQYLPSEAGFHRTFAIIVALLGCLATAAGYRKHHRLRVVALMATALTCIVAGAWRDSSLLTILGSVLMITAHVVNHTFCKACPSCQTHGESHHS